MFPTPKSLQGRRTTEPPTPADHARRAQSAGAGGSVIMRHEGAQPAPSRVCVFARTTACGACLSASPPREAFGRGQRGDFFSLPQDGLRDRVGQSGGRPFAFRTPLLHGLHPSSTGLFSTRQHVTPCGAAHLATSASTMCPRGQYEVVQFCFQNVCDHVALSPACSRECILSTAQSNISTHQSCQFEYN